MTDEDSAVIGENAQYQEQHSAFITDSGCGTCGEPLVAPCHYPLSPEAALEHLAAQANRSILALTSMAWDWRMDWSDFDGRTLVSQVDDCLCPLLLALQATHSGSYQHQDPT